jgi:hypothetical protein
MQENKAILVRRDTLRLYLTFTLGSAVYWWVVCPMLYPDGSVARQHDRFLACVLNACAWIGFCGIMGSVYRAVNANKKRALGAAVLWAAGLTVVFVPMVIFRDGIAAWMDSATTHILSSEYRGLVDIPVQNDALISHGIWMERWAAWEIQTIELAYLWCLALVLGLLALTPVAQWRLAGVVAAVATFALSLSFSLAFGLTEATYDLFHHGVIAGPMAVDLAAPGLAAWPESALASPFVFVITFVGLGLVERWKRADRRASVEAEGQDKP